MNLTSLPDILALARAGSTGRAWTAFVSSGYEEARDNPGILTLKGRLLKDLARKAKDIERIHYYRRSAQAYAEAAALKPDSYPLINAATMSLFGGESDRMRALAHEVLALIQTGTGQGETPYWHNATQAEAMLLLGDTGAAKTAFAEAITYAPLAWEDRAATLRQFRQILAFRQEEQIWLEALAPPPSLYFSGMIGLAANDEAAKNAIEKAVDDIDPAFGYGALAAGADILIAEALVKRGAELHIVLPVIPSLFRAISVQPFGPEWGARFDALLETAASVDIVDGGPELSLAAVDVASQVAKGRAVDNATRLESSTVGLMVAGLGHDHEPVAGSRILTLHPSAAVQGHPPLAMAAQSVMVAMTNNHGGNGTADDVTLHAYPGIAEAENALIQLRRDAPNVTVAISLGIDHGSPDMRRLQIVRMLRSAASGTTITSTEAAMALKARIPEMWVEALGELPDIGGAIILYAIAI